MTLDVMNDHGQLSLSMSGVDTALALGATETGGEITFCDWEGREKTTLPDDLEL